MLKSLYDEGILLLFLVSILKLGCKNWFPSGSSPIPVKSKLKSTIKNRGSIISSIILKEFLNDIEGGSGS